MTIQDLNGDHSVPATDANICIVGAGAAGLALASEFCDSGKRVILLEKGPPQYHTDLPPPDDVEILGHRFTGAREGRAQAFGGSTNRWGGKCHPLSDCDFMHRDWVPHSGWPIGKAELDDYYRLAESFLGLSGFDYSDRSWKLLGFDAPNIDSEILGMGFSKFNSEVLGGNGEGIQDIGALVRPRLELSEKVHVYCNATTTELVLDENGESIREVKVCNSKGEVSTVSAATFILCGGGLEIPRLLLCSRNQNSAGIGNDRDLVGRFFTDHPLISAAKVHTDKPLWLQERYNLIKSPGQIFWPNFTLTRSTQEQEKLLNCNANLFFDWHPESGIQAAMDLYRGMLGSRMPPDFGLKLWRIVKRFPEVMFFGSRYFLTNKWPTPKPINIRFRCHLEQLPDPDSRLSLTDQVDAYGMPCLSVDWRLHDIERRTAEVMVARADRAFQQAGIGRVTAEPCILETSNDWHEMVIDSYHHIGATRMSDSPETGVVDKNCKVFGTRNLYISSCSVFPTGGSENPTFTIVALAIRLARHLQALHP